ncbi:hypothetical protein PAE9249_04756 [Paenibacillus sp. CECT 9249]|uniref:N-acetylmuramoyl-L-alanine amidase family protein n=1 Tax=Paenibacillus sp. CECT 9249 TaxID=2845385 RepID=UPI001E38DA7E|nr:N-acetylmuramoyl-L-alanine amidase family protein [Paenibacillus sp. CECT 9249]CAH0122209.1 hypothetical protein PAE9249_04756 [Paenibacillus sp. CECT 9249]
MRKLTVLLFFCFTLLAIPGLGHAATNPTLYLDGESLSLPEEITMKNNSVMIPLRVVVEELGFQVDWDAKTRTVTIHKSDQVIKLVVDKKEAEVNGKKIALDTLPYIKSGTTLVPLRFVGEQMGLVVDWDNATKSVYLFTADYGSEVTEPSTPASPPSDGDGTVGKPGASEGPEDNGGAAGPDESETASVGTISFANDRLWIGIAGSVKPKQQTLTNPDRIVVDLPHTKFTDAFLSGQSFDNTGQGRVEVEDHPVVESIRFSQFTDSPATVRIVIDLKQRHHFRVSTDPDVGLVMIDVSENAVPDSNADKPADGKYVVVIDAGHGDHDPGAISVRKRNEKDFNLALALKVRDAFENDPDVQIMMTRSDDTFVDLYDRAGYANSNDADLFVSIHANSIDKPSVSGTEVYYRTPQSEEFAKVMHRNVVRGAGLPDRNVRTANFVVIRETTMPSVLLEIGYLTNTTDEALLFDEDFQKRVAQSIKDGIKEYLGLQ